MRLFKKRKRFYIESTSDPKLYWNPIFKFLVHYLGDNCYMSRLKAKRHLEKAIYYSKSYYPFAKEKFKIKEVL